MKSLLILGAGGFGRMIKETALALGYEEVLFLDDTAKDDEYYDQRSLRRKTMGRAVESAP